MPLDPPEELSSRERERFESGWRAMQQGNLETAASELEDLSRRFGRSAEIATARGFLELRLGSVPSAERYFETALRERASYGPARAGYLLSALATGDEERAYDLVEGLADDFPQHPLVDRYQTTLQVNIAESRLARARELDQEGSYAEAAEAYMSALEVAPGVGALYLEAAEAELKAGHADRAARHALRATELEPDNAEAFRVLGEAHYAGDDISGAYEAYRRAAELNSGDAEIRSRLEVIKREYEEENLPPEYVGLPAAERVTRAQLATLFYMELRSAIDGAPASEPVIATDIATSWASTFISEVVGVGILRVFPNHTFQPEGVVRRLELSEALERALERLAPQAYGEMMDSMRFDREFSDLPASNPSFESASVAVELGLLDIGDDGKFEPQAFVSGDEAVSAVEALAGHLSP